MGTSCSFCRVLRVAVWYRNQHILGGIVQRLLDPTRSVWGPETSENQHRGPQTVSPMRHALGGTHMGAFSSPGFARSRVPPPFYSVSSNRVRQRLRLRRASMRLKRTCARSERRQRVTSTSTQSCWRSDQSFRTGARCGVAPVGSETIASFDFDGPARTVMPPCSPAPVRQTATSRPAVQLAPPAPTFLCRSPARRRARSANPDRQRRGFCSGHGQDRRR
jgi:hypothetical protein